MGGVMRWHTCRVDLCSSDAIQTTKFRLASDKENASQVLREANHEAISKICFACDFLRQSQTDLLPNDNLFCTGSIDDDRCEPKPDFHVPLIPLPISERGPPVFISA